MFEFDESKSQSNLKKHGIDFVEAQKLWDDSNLLEIPKEPNLFLPNHAGDEYRGFQALLEENHMRNFLLWHEEDKARRDDKGFEYVYHAKRAIDRYNQERNNFIEKMDQWLVQHLSPRSEGVPFNSETPGMILDRLSILSLKAFHMHEESVREDATTEQQEACTKKLAVINMQENDLIKAGQALVNAVKAGTRSFRVYYQFKMYNDPALNPQLYQKKDLG